MFYDRFIKLCKERGIAPTRAAIEAGLSKSTVTKWKNTSESEPSGTVIKKLADYFGITRAELLGEKSDQKEKPLVNGDEELTEYLEMLKNRSECRMLFKLAKGATKEDPFEPVFKTAYRNKQNSNSILRMWKSFRRALDIGMGAELYRNKIIKSVVADDLTPYCLRHTFCTDLQRAGVPINIAKELMGHSDISVTANIYTHKDSAVLHENMELLSSKKDAISKTVSKNLKAYG